MMSRPFGVGPADIAAPLLAAGASFFTLLSWDGLSEDASAFLVPLFSLALGVAGLGVALRAAGVVAPLVPQLQLLAVLLVLHQAWGAGDLLAGWLPTPASIETAVSVLEQSAETSTQYAAPVPAEATLFAPMMTAVGAVVILCVDALACTLRRPPLAGLPLLAAFTLPVALLGGVPWSVFALTAAAFVLLLATDQARTLGRWGGRLAAGPSVTLEDSQPREVRLSTVWPAAGRIGVVGIGLAVVAPILVPAGQGLFGGQGPGVGGTGDGVRLENPFIDIKRDLTRGADVPLVVATTDDPEPAYLRLSVLDEYDGSLWRPSKRDIPAANRADGELAAPPGLEPETRRVEHSWSLTVTDAFATTWLPTPYPATAVNAEGDWRYDDDTLDLVTADRGADAAGMSYTATGLELLPRPEELAVAPTGPRHITFDNTQLPESVPSWVYELARDVTAGATTQYERAVQLQEWFRSDGGFTYSLERSSGNSIEQLERFLGEGPDSRVGYCEQFSAAMALMARTLDIPARVAVGFLTPAAEGGDRWVYSTHDLHAWPELYFQGAGWVRFEPTPQVRTGTPPGYTTAVVPQDDPVATPSVAPTSEVPERDRAAQEQAEAAAAGSSDGGLPGWAPWAGGVVALVTLLCAPRLARVLVRRRRYAAAGLDGLVEAGWRELRATALDLGLGWDDAQTLRTRARALARYLRVGGQSEVEPGVRQPTVGDELRALERLVLLLERARYSRSGLSGGPGDLDQPDVVALVTTVCEGLLRAAGPRARRRAAWLPVSLWRTGPVITSSRDQWSLLLGGRRSAHGDRAQGQAAADPVGAGAEPARRPGADEVLI